MDKKVVLITGASSGIGLELSKMFIKKGYVVYGASRNEFSMEGLNHLKCDVSSSDQCKYVINEIIRREGKIDILIKINFTFIIDFL